MFAALYGTATARAWVSSVEDPAAPDQDHFALFVRWADAMGWSDPEGDGGLWGMNDAGGESSSTTARRGGLAAWFQIEAHPVAPTMSLPVQPFLRCALDVCARLTTIDLAEVVLLLPVHRLGPRPLGARASMRTAPWFSYCDPDRRTDIRFALTVGQSAPAGALEAGIGRFLRLQQRVLTSPEPERDHGAPLDAGLPFDDHLWDGPPAASCTVTGRLAEWGPEAIGWLAQTLAECCAAEGLASPALLTVTRAVETTSADRRGHPA